MPGNELTFDTLSSKPNIKHALDTLRSKPGLESVEFADQFEIGRHLSKTIVEIKDCMNGLARTFMDLQDARLDIPNQDRLDYFCRIAVVGQMKAGKSSFINAIAGRSEFLPTHVNPWTAVPTALYFGIPGKPKHGAEFEFFSEDEWDRLGESRSSLPEPYGQVNSEEDADTARSVWMRALLRLGNQYAKLLGQRHAYKRVTRDVLAQYLCAGPPISEPSRHAKPGRYADITRAAHVYLPPAPFVWPSIMIDTPGLNDPSFIRLKTTQNALENADIYVVVLTALQPLSITDIALLRLLRALDKRRFLVFVNRVDELRGRQDVSAVISHVKARLEAEFPDTEISICYGSAHWANTANSGTSGEVEAITRSEMFSAHMDRGDQAAASAPPSDHLRARRLLLAQSGLPDVANALSRLMHSSYMRADGVKIIDEMSSVASMAASKARGELRSIMSLDRNAETHENAFSTTIALRQIDEQIDRVSNVQNTIQEILNQFQLEQDEVIQSSVGRMNNAFNSTVDAFIREQRQKLLARPKHRSFNDYWADAHSLVDRMEHCFLEEFREATQAILDLQHSYIDKLRVQLQVASLNASQSHDEATSLVLDVRAALPALGRLNLVDIARLRWSSFWKAHLSPEQLAEEIAQKISDQFSDVPRQMSEIAERELRRYAADGRWTVEAVAAEASRTTIDRLKNLREAIDDYKNSQEKEFRVKIQKKYAKRIQELNKSIATFENIEVRLNNLAVSGPSGDA